MRSRVSRFVGANLYEEIMVFPSGSEELLDEVFNHVL
jgi:hypothetical protein